MDDLSVFTKTAISVELFYRTIRDDAVAGQMMADLLVGVAQRLDTDLVTVTISVLEVSKMMNELGFFKSKAFADLIANAITEAEFCDYVVAETENIIGHLPPPGAVVH